MRPDALAALSPAKINLTLHVAGRRPDGFHEIESLVAVLNWGDNLSVAQRDDGRITLECDDPAAPGDASNLAVRAALALRDAVELQSGFNPSFGATGSDRPNPLGAHIAIRKRIPLGAGLGGGSSNAATTLNLLNRLWNLRLPVERLASIAAAVGSDVPLFLHGGMCILRGRGEIIEPVATPAGGYVLLILPPLTCSTPAVYRRWDELNESCARPPAAEVLTQIARDGLAQAALFNDLEPAAMSVCPELAELRGALRDRCGLNVHMTGSGACFFCLFAGSDSAAEAARRVRDCQNAVRTVPVAIG